jgi:putative peptidoglycan lipid II flippase
MDGSRPHPLITGTKITSLGTLASRLLGMVRDIATASLLGMSHGGVMDAFVLAFRVPNTFRRLFGEGALAASYLPVVTQLLEHDRPKAWQLASVLLAWLAVLLSVVTLLGEMACGAVYLLGYDVPGMGLLTGMTAVMLPYMLFICMAAQVAATLQALGHFTAPALAPLVMNGCWLAAVWGVAPWLAPDRQRQAYAVAGAVLVSGVLQLAVQWRVLCRLGFQFQYHWPNARQSMFQIAAAMVPMTVGLAITQLNTLMDSLIAWSLAAPADGPERIAWLGGIRYPMAQGAAASIYYGERLYEFPLALLGIAVATAIYPLLSRHAARGDHDSLRDDLTLGLRLVLFLGVPAGAGLVLLAHPLSRLLFEHGHFTPEDTLRTSRMVVCYGVGVWAYCATPVLVRGFYALGDRLTPVKIGSAMIGLNLVLNLTLVWPMAEAGLAVATSAAAMGQVVLLVLIFSRTKIALDWHSLGKTAARAVGATILMTAASGVALAGVQSAGSGLVGQLTQVAVPTAVGLAVYLVSYHLFRGHELKMMFPGRQIRVVERNPDEW